MTPEAENYFTEMELLFMQPGWQHFIDDMTNNQEALRSAVLGSETPKDLYRAQGRYQVFQQVLTYQGLIEGAKKSIQEQEEEEQDETNVRLRVLQPEV